MKINNDYLNTSEENVENKIKNNIKNTLIIDFNEKFLATIIDIRRNTLTLKLDNGKVLQGKMNNLLEAHIGKNAVFMAKRGIDGQILLEILDSKNNSMQSNIIKDILTELDIPLTEENKSLIKYLIDNNVVLSKETIGKALYFKYINRDLITNDKILLLLKEEFPLQEKSVTMLNKSINGDYNLKNIINEFSKDILNNNTALNKFLKNFNYILQNNENIIFSKEDILKTLLIDIKEPENLKEYPEKLKVISEFMDKILKTDMDNLKNTINQFKESLEFMSNIKTNKEYIQIPFILNQQANNCELIIYKNKKNKEINKKHISLLISLELVHLGKINTFINKEENNINFEFSSSKKKVLKIIKNKIPLLISKINELGYTSHVMYKKIEEDINILQNTGKELNNKNNRYVMDIRV